MKKNTHWITIPDDELHTPASENNKSDKEKIDGKHIKSNIVFGIAFVVLVLVTFAMLAPKQFSGLLKGSLFDTSGLSESQMKVTLLPQKTSSESTTSSSTSSTSSTSSSGSAATTSTSSASPTTSSTSSTSTSSGGATSSTSSTGSTGSSGSGGTSSSGTLVQPESKAVSISVTPVSTTAKDCTTDMTCFLPYLKDCTLAKGTYAFKISNNDFDTSLEITGSESTNCLVTVKVTKSPDTYITNTDTKCKIPQGTYTQTVLDALVASTSSLSKQISNSYCTGTASTNLKTYLDNLSTSSSASSTSSQSATDLKTALQSISSQTYPAATTTTTTTTPTSVTSTATIGQSSTTVTPAFKTNSYKVTTTPQQVLQNNLASGYSTGTSASSVASGNAVTYYQPYSVSIVQSKVQSNSGYSSQTSKSLSSVKSTPNSGPTEMILITFVITFLGLAGWKFRKIFA